MYKNTIGFRYNLIIFLCNFEIYSQYMKSIFNTLGGIGEAVMSAVAMERDIIVKHLAVPRIPRSGKCDELLEMFGISASAVVKAAKEISSL